MQDPKKKGKYIKLRFCNSISWPPAITSLLVQKRQEELGKSFQVAAPNKRDYITNFLNYLQLFSSITIKCFLRCPNIVFKRCVILHLMIYITSQSQVTTTEVNFKVSSSNLQQNPICGAWQNSVELVEFGSGHSQTQLDPLP